VSVLALYLAFGPGPQPTDAPHRARRRALGERRLDAGSVFYSLPGMVRGGTMTKLNQLLARLRAMLKR
jgi:hypothetical protein